ncbi:MAG: dihydroxy-acid dehydratase, partial [Rhodoglobus sp.]
RNAYIHRAWMRRGLPDDALDSTKPQIAIANTASDLTPCNAHLNEVAESVKQGVWAAGGVPYNLPVVSLGETQVKPTAMLWRNLAAMAMEEMFRANPIDGLVLLGGCDKTIPALLMAAASVNLPAVVVPGGPMLTGYFRGEALGCGTDVWRLSEEARAGTITNGQFIQSEQSMIRSKGHCNTMGTASTMAVVAEALGMSIPGFAGTPAADARLLSLSHDTGRLIVDMVTEGRRPSDIMTKQSFLNAIIAVAAVGGSTNSVMHLLAIAGRLGLDVTLDDFDAAGAGVPVLANLQPSGAFLMDDLYRAGGVLALLTQVRDLLHSEPITVTGLPLVDYLVDRPVYDATVILPREAPLMADAGIAVLRGNLAPRGAIIKPSAATAELLQHTGPAVVFDSIEDLRARIDDPDLGHAWVAARAAAAQHEHGVGGDVEVGNM